MNRIRLAGLVVFAIGVAACAPGGRVCGDGFCDSRFETAGTCAVDCGGAVCGDGFCDAGETAGGCARDCGSCGDGLCTASIGETCSGCRVDCGACTATCGDGVCRATDGETCSTCAADCGACTGCGDGVCGATETCTTCASDCGACGPQADPYETCGGATTCFLPRDSCTAITNSTVTRSMCTTSCTTDADCDDDMFGALGDCVFYGGAGTCFHRCIDSSDCYPGFACYVPSGSTGALGNICLPDAGPPATVAAYDRCTTSSDCLDGLMCINYAVGSASENLCSWSPCSSDSDCPFDSRGGRGACIFIGGVSSCWERCNVRADCINTFDFDCIDVDAGGSGPLVCTPR